MQYKEIKNREVQLQHKEDKKRFDLYLIQVSEEENRIMERKYVKKKMAENFPELMEEINPPIEEAWHMYMKLDKQKVHT